MLSWRDSSVKCPVGSEHVRVPGMGIDRLDRAGVSDTPFFGPFPSPCVADHDEVNNLVHGHALRRLDSSRVVRLTSGS